MLGWVCKTHRLMRVIIRIILVIVNVLEDVFACVHADVCAPFDRWSVVVVAALCVQATSGLLELHAFWLRRITAHM